MASPTFQLLFLILLASLTIIPTTTIARPHPNLITRICKTTPYYNLCLSTLKSNPTSSKSDTKGLAVITLNAAASNATSTATYLSSQLLPPSSTSSDPATALKNKVLNLCAEKYSAATDSFHSSAQEVAADMYDYAQVDAEAATAYTDSCRNAFKRVGIDYPTEMVVREQSLKKIGAVAVGIILNVLNSSNPALSSKGDQLH